MQPLQLLSYIIGPHMEEHQWLVVNPLSPQLGLDESGYELPPVPGNQAGQVL